MHTGLLSLVTTQEAQDSSCGTASRLQVLDSARNFDVGDVQLLSSYTHGPCRFSFARVHLQVQDATGRWVDVVMQKNEVAILLGATSTRATGGLLKAATTRVVRSQ